VTTNPSASPRATAKNEVTVHSPANVVASALASAPDDSLRGQAEPVPVERDGSFEIVDAQRDERDAWLHAHAPLIQPHAATAPQLRAGLWRPLLAAKQPPALRTHGIQAEGFRPRSRKDAGSAEDFLPGRSLQ